MTKKTGDPLEDDLRVTIAVALSTAPSGTLSLAIRGQPLARERAADELVDRIATSLSRRFEIGRLDAVSGIYISNYADPR